MGKKISVLSVFDPVRGDFQLDATLESYFSQAVDPSDFELLLLATEQGCHDLMGKELERLSSRKPAGLDVRAVFCGETESRAKAVNAGLKLCQADLIYIVADDFLLPKDAVQATLNFHRAHPDERMVAVGGAIVSSDLRSDFVDWLERSGSLFGVPFHPDMTAVPDDFFYLGNVSFKKSLLDKAGPFNEAFPYHAWDDWEMGLRLVKLGMRSTLLPETLAEHRHRLDIADRCRTMRIAGLSARIFQHENPAFFGPWRTCWRGSMLFERLRAACYGALYRRFPGQKRQAAYFRSVTQLAFQRGYLDGR